MLRRSRISVRPNVRPAGRGGTPVASQEALHPTQEAPPLETPASVDSVLADGVVKSTSTASWTVKPSETHLDTGTEDGKDPDGEMSCSSTPLPGGLQRRKRFSVMPNLAKPRLAPAPTRSSVRAPKSPVKSMFETPAPDAHSSCPAGQNGEVIPQGLHSPRRQRPSGGGVLAKTSLLTPTSPTTEEPPKDLDSSLVPQSADQDGLQGSKLDMPKPSLQSGCPTGSQAKEVPQKPLEKAEATESGQTLASNSTKYGLSLPPGSSRLSRLLNDAEDLHRLAKARKLRELLRQEKHKEKKFKRAKAVVKEYTMDHSKMTMRDLIYYLPITNPMTSYLEEIKDSDNVNAICSSQLREESPETVQELEVASEPMCPRLMEDEEGEDEGALNEQSDDSLMVPRVKVAEDGSLILDEDSLTVEVLRAKGPNLVEGRDPIFERGSTTTYSSFRKSKHTKPWSNQETDMFFLAISMVGTDFSMICQLFPHRVRTEIKNKFKKEERANAWRIDKAFKERRKLDLEFFTKLLQKILEVQNAKNKKPKSLCEKNTANRKCKQKERKSQRRLSDVEEDGEEEDNENSDMAEVEGEKENEDVSNEDVTTAQSSERKKKNCSKEEISPGEPEGKKKNNKRKSAEEQEEESEAALPEDHSTADGLETTEDPTGPAKRSVIDQAQLSRGGAVFPRPSLGRRRGLKAQTLCTKLKEDALLARDESTSEGGSRKQVEVEGLPVELPKQKTRAVDCLSSDEEENSSPPQKLTRYGRLSKPIDHLNYPAKEDESVPGSSQEATSSRAIPSSPMSKKPRVKPLSRHTVLSARSRAEPKRSRLVTLRASQADDSEDEEQEPMEILDEEGSSTPVFVPFGLRSPQPVFAEVEETMEEFNLSVNVPDELGFSQDTICPNALCEQAQSRVSPMPCEHQLDLLVDVIDFLSPNHTEASEESYNEAAHTLLAIGNLANLSQPTQEYDSIQDNNSSQDCNLTQDDISGPPTVIDDGAVPQDYETEVASQSPVHLQSCINASEKQTSGTSKAAETTEQVAKKDHVLLSFPGDYPIVDLGFMVNEESANSQGDKVLIAHDSLTASQPTAPKSPRKSRLCKFPPKPSFGWDTSTSRSKPQLSENTETLPTNNTVEDSTSAPLASTSDTLLQGSLHTVNESIPDLDIVNPGIKKSILSVTHSEETLVSQLEESEAVSASKVRRSRFPKVKPKPNLGHATRGVLSKPKASQDTDSHSHAIEDPPPTSIHESQERVVMAGSVSQRKSGSRGSSPTISNAHISGVKTKPNLGVISKIVGEHTEPQSAVQICDQQQAVQIIQHQCPEPSDKALICGPNPRRSVEESNLETLTINSVTKESTWLVEDPFTIDSEEGDSNTSRKEDSELEAAMHLESEYKQKAILTRIGRLPKLKPNPIHSRTSRAIKTKLPETIPSVSLEPLLIEDSLRSSIPQPVSDIIFSRPQLTEQVLGPVLTESKGQNTSARRLSREDNKQSKEVGQNSFERAKLLEMELSNADLPVKMASSDRRARLPKAKPNFSRGAKPARVQRPQNATPSKLVEDESGKGVRDSQETSLVSGSSSEIQLPRVGAEAIKVSLDQHEIVLENASLAPAIVAQTLFETKEVEPAVVEGQAQSIISTHFNVLADQTTLDPEEPFFILSLTPVLVAESESPPFLPTTDLSLQLSNNIACSYYESDDPADGGEATVKVKPYAATWKLPGHIPCEDQAHNDPAQICLLPDPVAGSSTTDLPTDTEETSGSGAGYKSKHQIAPVATSSPLSRAKRSVHQGLLFDTATCGGKKRATAPPEAPTSKDSTAPVPETMTTHSSQRLTHPEMNTSLSATIFKMPVDQRDDSTNIEMSSKDKAATQLANSTFMESSSASEEPTDISQFFFSDIFTEVDEG